MSEKSAPAMDLFGLAGGIGTSQLPQFVLFDHKFCEAAIQANGERRKYESRGFIKVLDPYVMNADFRCEAPFP